MKFRDMNTLRKAITCHENGKINDFNHVFEAADNYDVSDAILEGELDIISIGFKVSARYEDEDIRLSTNDS